MLKKNLIYPIKLSYLIVKKENTVYHQKIATTWNVNFLACDFQAVPRRRAFR